MRIVLSEQGKEEENCVCIEIQDLIERYQAEHKKSFEKWRRIDQEQFP